MTQKMKRAFALLLLMLMLMQSLTACGGAPADETEPPAAETETPVIPEEPEISDTPDAPETPKTPETPETPEAPEESKPAEMPAVPETPETPSEPEKPAEPEVSAVEKIAAEYTVVRRAQDSHKLFTTAQASIYNITKKLAGKAAKMGIDTVKESFDAAVGYDSPNAEVLIGNTNRKESIAAAKGLAAQDYIIQGTGNKIVLVGGTRFSTAAAVERFVRMLENNEIKDLSQPFTYKYEFLKENEIHPLCSDISSFVPVWAGTYCSPSWVGEGDFYETIYTLTHTKAEGAGRVAANAHRADFSYYPEGSLESFASAYLGGADVVEVDVRLTKDYIPVAFHDAQLRGLTNWSEMAGKNGLPTSPDVSDWTFDELKQLRFVKSGVVTDYRIVSYYEVLLFARNRLILTLDDKGQVDFDEEADLFPLARDTDSLECFIRWTVPLAKNYEWATREGVSQKYIDIMKFVKLCEEHGSGFCGAYNIYKNTAGWTNDYETQAEKESDWSAALAKNKRFLTSNRVVAMCNYLDTIGDPSDYSALLAKKKK